MNSPVSLPVSKSQLYRSPPYDKCWVVISQDLQYIKKYLLVPPMPHGLSVSLKAACALNCWAISTAPPLLLSSLSGWLENILFFNKYVSYFLYLGAFSVVLLSDSWPTRSRHAALIFWSLQKLWAWAHPLLTWKISPASLSVRRPRQKWLERVLLVSHKESTLISALELLVWKQNYSLNACVFIDKEFSSMYFSINLNLCSFDGSIRTQEALLVLCPRVYNTMTNSLETSELCSSP